MENEAASWLPLLSPEFYHAAVLCLPPRQKETFLSPTHQSGRVPFLAFQCSPGYYCNDSGMVLTTWAASGAAGGDPKKALV